MAGRTHVRSLPDLTPDPACHRCKHAEDRTSGTYCRIFLELIAYESAATDCDWYAPKEAP